MVGPCAEKVAGGGVLVQVEQTEDGWEVADVREDGLELRWG